MSRLQSLYERSPLWAQQLGVNLFGLYWRQLRLGGIFREETVRWQEREAWSAERFHDYLEQKLRRALLAAWDHTRFYPERWGGLGLTRERLAAFRLEELPLLPVWNRRELQRRPEEIWRDYHRGQRPALVRRTSGSTGMPFSVAFARSDWQRVFAAAEARAYRWAGVSLRQPRAMIGSRPIIPAGQRTPPFWRYNLFERQLYLSAFHLMPANVADYHRALWRFRPVTVVGYPSALASLARMLEQAGLEPPAARAVITASEPLWPRMRELLERVFHCPVHESYGLVENCAYATTCEQGRLHAHPDFGWVEILREDGTPAAAGQTGRLVATGLVNETALFIRYDTGDLAAWDQRPCPCGRMHLPVLARVVGRLEDLVVTPDGRETVRFDRTFLDCPGIVQSQVVQEAPDRIVLKVVAEGDYDARRAEELIRRRFREMLGETVQVTVERVESIPPGPGGKIRAVVSKLERRPDPAGPGD